MSFIESLSKDQYSKTTALGSAMYPSILKGVLYIQDYKVYKTLASVTIPAKSAAMVALE